MKTSFFVISFFFFNHLENRPLQINFDFIVCHVFFNVIIDVIPIRTPEFVFLFNLDRRKVMTYVVQMVNKSFRATVSTRKMLVFSIFSISCFTRQTLIQFLIALLRNWICVLDNRKPVLPVYNCWMMSNKHSWRERVRKNPHKGRTMAARSHSLVARNYHPPF